MSNYAKKIFSKVKFKQLVSKLDALREQFESSATTKKTLQFY